MALAAGEPVHVVPQRLGHSDVKTTLSIYAHALAHQKTDAAKRRPEPQQCGAGGEDARRRGPGAASGPRGSSA
jgi:hypothetical protein